jgi:hypothetical protein
MDSGLRPRLLDLGFITALLLLAATPLIFFRGKPQLDEPAYQLPFALVVAGVLAAWAVLRGRLPRPAAAEEAETTGRLAWWQTALVAGLLAACTYACFYLPLRIHFWGGADDCINFLDFPLLPSLKACDDGKSRPFVIVPPLAGAALTPNRIEGFLWLAAAMCWANALLLFAIVRQVLPRARVLPVAAAVLLIADRSDPARFFILWATNFYWMALGLLLLGVWLFLWSYRRGSRPLLLAGCLALAASLLLYEAAYPLALLVPALGWFMRAHRRRLAVWSYAWLGTLGLLGARLALFLAHKGADSYQAQAAGSGFRDPAVLWSTFLHHLEAALVNFQASGAWAVHRQTVAIVLGLVLAAAAVVAWRAGAAKAPRRGQYLVALGVAVLVFLLGLVPFLSMPYVFRTHFFAAPGQALVVAGGLCLVGSLLGRRLGAAVVAVAVAVVVANGTAEAVAAQRHQQTQPVTFERAVHLFRQVHGVCPNPPPDGLILLYYDDPTRVPFVCNYCCLQVSRRVFGAVMVPANRKDITGYSMEPVFHADGVTLDKGQAFGFPGKVGYDKVLAFRVAPDDTVTLMRRLPVRGLPPGHAAARYDPLAAIKPGPVTELDYLRFSHWMKRPHDLFDMKDGVLLGRGWGALEGNDRARSRRVGARGAEVVINPMGQTRRELRLVVEAEQAGRLEALDPAGRVLASADLTAGRQEVHFSVPTDPARLQLVRLRRQGGAGEFRAFCPGSQGGGAPPAPAPPNDVVAGELSLGDNWFHPERTPQCVYRWVGNDAEIILEEAAGRDEELVLAVAPGPSLGGQPLRLSLLDESGKAVASACVSNYEVVRLPLPAGAPAGSTFRLHAESGTQPASAEDPRILNMLVFRCAWRAD